MLHDNIDISHLVVYAQKIEKEKLQYQNREVKRIRTGDGNIFNARYDRKGRIKFKQSFSNQVSSSATPRANNDRVSNPKPQGGNSGDSYVARQKFSKMWQKT